MVAPAVRNASGCFRALGALENWALEYSGALAAPARFGEYHSFCICHFS